MKKILFLPAYSFPEKAASPYLSQNRNEAFANAGFIMEAYAPTPCRGITQEVREKYKKIKYEEMLNGKYRLHRFSMYAEGKNPVFRALRYSFCWIAQLWKGLWAKDVSCIFIASTPPIQGMLGALLKKWKNVPFVYNLQDIFPDSLVNNGLAKQGGMLWKIGRVIENFTYKNADKIIVISQDFKHNIMAKGVPEEKIEVIYNWVDQNAVLDVPREENKLFGKYGLDKDKFYVTYNGNIGMSQNMEMLLSVAEEMNIDYPEIHFVLVGEGAALNQVKSTVKDKNLENVHLLPFQPYEDISHVFSLGDVSLVISKPGTGAASVPSKTWSIMSASRPVLANFDENELKSIVEVNRCGIFTKSGDKEAFKESILTLYRDKKLCKEYGLNGRKFVLENLTREVGTQKYVDVMNSLMKEK